MSFIPIRAKHCVEQLNSVLELEGDVIEFGVYKGATTFRLAKHLKDNNSNKKVFACDTFMGIPEDDTHGSCKKGDFSYSLYRFINSIKENKFTNIIIPTKGDIRKTYNKFNESNKFCFAWLDMDIYSSTLFAVEFILPRLVKGGIVGFHDYNFEECKGVTKVVDENIDRTKYKEILNKNYCIFFKKL